MFSLIASLSLLISQESENFSLNRKIQQYQESQMEVGTYAEAEEAKRWDNRVYLATYPRSGNHWMRYLIEEATGITTSSVYKDPDPPHSEKLKKYICSWRRFQEYWNIEQNVFTVRYEDLCQNPKNYLQMILERIGYQVKEEDIQRAVVAYPPTGEFLKHIDHFTEEQLLLIEEELGDLMELYGYELKKI